MFVRLSGDWYDLEEFATRHPGGSKVIESVKGTDATVLFRSIHTMGEEGNESATKILASAAKFKVPIEKVPPQIAAACPVVPEFEWDTPFQKDILNHLRDYLKSIKSPNQTLRQAAKMTYTRMALLSVLFTIRMICWYYHFTAWSYWTLIAAPVMEWIFSSNIFHDASHSSVSVIPWVNRVMQHVSFFTTSPSLWFFQHIIAHHPYTNMKDYDPDLGRPSTHLKISQGKKPYGPFTLALYWTLAQPVIAWVMDPEAWVVKAYNEIVPVKNKPFNGYLLHFLGRFLMFFVWSGWAYLFAPTWGYAFIWATVPVVVFSLTFMFCTQLTHMNETSMGNGVHVVNSKGENPDWYAHQIVTAVDHSIGSRFWTLFTSGLNYQIEHHLFPTVNHCHLPKLQAGVEAICKKHNVAYRTATVTECLLAYWDLMVGFNNN